MSQQRGASSGAAHDNPGFLQLRLRIDGDRLVVRDARHVEGKLVEEDRIHHGTGWEAALGGQRIALGSVPDPGFEIRAYPNPNGAPEQRGHHVTPNPHPGFVVRIPADRLRNLNLADLEVTLREVTGNPPGPASGAALRSADLRAVTRPIAQLPPGWFGQLPPQTQTTLQEALTR